MTAQPLKVIYMETLVFRENRSKKKRFNEKRIGQMTAASRGISVRRIDQDKRNLSQFNIIVLVPAYNEAKYIGPLITSIRNYPVRVMVINDGSTDITAAIALSAGAEVISFPLNRGKGTALNYGFREAAKLNPDAIVMIDGDGQHFPEEIPQLLFPILSGRADIAIGSRYPNGHSGVPFLRRLGHFFFNQLTNFASGVQVSDSQSGFRAFSRRAYRNIHFFSKGFSAESEMQFLAGREELRVTDVPTSVQYHFASKRSVFSQGLEVLGGIIGLVGRYRPHLFYRFHGVLFFLLGLIMGFLAIGQSLVTNDLAASYVLISIVAIVVGLMILSSGLT